LNAPYHFGRFELNPTTRQLLVDGKGVALGARAFDVLLALIERRERLVTKNELLELAWPGLVVEENNLQVQISSLRKLLGPQSIATIPGRGYRFTCGLDTSAVLIPDKATIADPADADNNSNAAKSLDAESEATVELQRGAVSHQTAYDAANGEAPPSHTRRWPISALSTGLAILIGAGAILSLAHYRSVNQSAKTGVRTVPTSPVATTAGALSILVLPFANETGDPQKAYIADALTTSITSDLSRIRDAFIIPSTTAFTYRDKKASVQQIGKDAGVRFVLQGSVLSSGEKIRISVQLADTQSGAQLWSETVDGELTNLFALEDRVTTRTGNSIGYQMVIVAAREAETRKSSPKAADLMLRARALRLRPQSLKNWQQMEAWYRQVLALEPNNVSAMVGLAISLTLQAAKFGYAINHVAAEKKFAEGRDLAVKARELDPDNPGVYSVIALYAGAHGDYPGYLRAAETQFSLDPKNPSSHNSLALAYYYAGEPRRAIELLTQAINLDPRHPFAALYENLGYANFMLGDNDAALTWAQKALEISPASSDAYALLAMAYVLKGDNAKAREAAANARRTDPSYKLFEWDTSQPSYPVAYKKFFENKFLPAWRKAGLPE